MGLNLDELAVINGELAALVGAGMPLEPGLEQLAADTPGRLGRCARELAERLRQGEALDDVLADPKLGFPPMYAAVLRAGQRSGRLGPAMELFAETLARLRDTRQAVIAACVYPLIVICVACVVAAFTAAHVLPRIRQAMLALAGIVPGWREAWAGWLIPAGLLIVAAAWWWRRSRQAHLLVPGDVGSTLAWLPWMRPVARWSRQAILADLLRLFIAQGIPLPEALRGAARATGDPRTVRAAETAAARIEAGDVLANGPGGEGSKDAELPPLLRWLLITAQREGRLLPALEAASARYHQRVLLAAERVRVLLPVTITAATGGTVVFVYGWFLFAPYTALLRALSNAVGG